MQDESFPKIRKEFKVLLQGIRTFLHVRETPAQAAQRCLDFWQSGFAQKVDHPFRPLSAEVLVQDVDPRGRCRCIKGDAHTHASAQFFIASSAALDNAAQVEEALLVLPLF